MDLVPGTGNTMTVTHYLPDDLDGCSKILLLVGHTPAAGHPIHYGPGGGKLSNFKFVYYELSIYACAL